MSITTLLGSSSLVFGIPLLVLAILVIQLFHLTVVMAWCDAQTKDLRYYGRPFAQRREFKRSLARHRMILGPILWLLARCRRPGFADGTFHFRGVAGPKGTCSRDDFERAASYPPDPDDVFVVTQMKCGTTWMQHLAVQVLTRGKASLPEDGTALYALSPWLESSKTVSPAAAPLIGECRPSRVIKTHLPTSLCPYSPRAKYIYVARDPVSCFASCVDFVRSNLQEFAPPLQACEQWFRSDQMWWGTWPAHVAGWWSWAQQRENVLFIRFEDMKRDLAHVARQVADHLEQPRLADCEVAAIVRKCSFAYMRDHADSFEMHPPHILQASGQFFVSGKLTRHQDIPTAMASRLAEWSRQSLDAYGVPSERLFPTRRLNAQSPSMT
jgi:hypothetical protein